MQAGRLRRAARRQRFQPANIERINRHVRLDRRGRRGPQRRLVVDVRTADSVAEIDDRFLLRDLAEPLHQGLQRQQLAIGVKLVVVGVVYREGTARLRSAFRAPGPVALKALSLSRRVSGECAKDLRFVACKVQIHAQRSGQ